MGLYECAERFAVAIDGGSWSRFPGNVELPQVWAALPLVRKVRVPSASSAYVYAEVGLYGREKVPSESRWASFFFGRGVARSHAPPDLKSITYADVVEAVEAADAAIAPPRSWLFVHHVDWLALCVRFCPPFLASRPEARVPTVLGLPVYVAMPGSSAAAFLEAQLGASRGKGLFIDEWLALALIERWEREEARRTGSQAVSFADE